jgi:hypothetical protein
VIEDLEQCYKNTENPYYAWLAIGLCLKSKAAFPDWLESYLSATSERIKTRSLSLATFGFPARQGWNLKRALQADANGRGLIRRFAALRNAGMPEREALIEATGTEERGARKAFKRAKQVMFGGPIPESVPPPSNEELKATLKKAFDEIQKAGSGKLVLALANQDGSLYEVKLEPDESGIMRKVHEERHPAPSSAEVRP